MVYATSRMTENELIEGCLANDRRAQKELYDRYSRAMYTVAYRITNDFDLANDVLQEAFVDFAARLPVRITRPSASTTSSARTASRIVP